MYATANTATYRDASAVNTAMAGVYKNMGLAVLVSMLVSHYVGTNAALMAFFFTGALSLYLNFINLFLHLLHLFGERK